MPVFVVIAKRGVDRVKGHIDDLPRESVYQLTDDAWLVDYPGTSRTLAELLKIRGTDENLTGIAFSVGNYSGRFSTDVWEWLGLHSKDGGT